MWVYEIDNHWAYREQLSPSINSPAPPQPQLPTIMTVRSSKGFARPLLKPLLNPYSRIFHWYDGNQYIMAGWNWSIQSKPTTFGQLSHKRLSYIKLIERTWPPNEIHIRIHKEHPQLHIANMAPTTMEAIFKIHWQRITLISQQWPRPNEYP